MPGETGLDWQIILTDRIFACMGMTDKICCTPKG
jgi:hypothetical protein